MSKAMRDMALLRSEVRELGAALGRIISRIEGSETFDTVEALRKLAKARRANDADADRLLAKAVAELEPREAFNQAMAFTLYFELVNLAEENFRIMLLRRRRVAHAQGRDEGRPIRESIEAAVMELKAAGVGEDEMQRLVDRLGIELVFTAHPTETKRRTLLAKLQAPRGDPARAGAARVDAGHLGPGRGDGRARDRVALAHRPQPHRAPRGQGRGPHRPLVL